ncbi:MAG: hypothetical protein Q4B17_06885 [Lautropia sp.]|nr:hypothetical protein [Lautropia sp.]
MKKIGALSSLRHEPDGVREHTTPAHHPPVHRPLFATLLVALGCCWALPAQAQLNKAVYEVSFDGTAGFDTKDGPGYDSGPNNGIVRTHDEFAYRVSLSSTGADQDMRIQLTLARGADNRPLAAFSYLPNLCIASKSTLSADRQSIDCRIADVKESFTRAVRFVTRILGTAPNGAQLPPATIRVSSRAVPDLAVTNTARTITVSAAPFYDVFLENSFMGNPKAYGYFPKNGPNGEDGMYHRPLVGLIARHPNGHGKKGVEQLDPSKPVRIVLNTRGYPSSVKVDNWHVAPRFDGDEAATGSFHDGCGSNFSGRPALASGNAINTHDRIQDLGPHNSTANNRVTNGGDCNIESSDREQITLSLNGVNTTLAHSPTQTATGRKIPETDHWVANKALVLWTELNDRDYPKGQDITHTLAFSSIEGQSISGRPIQGNGNQISYVFRSEHDGTARKLFSPDALSKAPLQATPDPKYIPGDSIVNYVAPGQQLLATVRYVNRGTTTHQNLLICDILDRTAFTLAPYFHGWPEVLNAPGITPRVQYGAPPDGSSMYFPSVDSAPLEDEVKGAGSPLGRSAYMQARCDDPAIRWFDEPRQAEAAGGVVYVRATSPELPGGGMIFLHLQGLELRRTWAASTTVEAPVRGQRVAGTPIEAGEIIRNRGFVKTDSLPESRFTGLRDHFKVVPTLTTSQIDKRITYPSTAGATPVPANSTVEYELTPRYSTLYMPMPGTVTVTDILPAGAIYQKDSARVDGQPHEPRVEHDKPATGMTSLTWTFPDRMPFEGKIGDAPALATIRFRIRLDPRLTDHTVISNLATISGGPHDDVPDCVYDPVHQNLGRCAKMAKADIRVLTPPGFLLEKSSDREVIEPGETFNYWLTLLPIGLEIRQPDIPDVIDILPFVGDGTANPALSFSARQPASTFDPGAYALSAVHTPASDPDATVFFTRAAPQSIHNDPRDPSNAIPGGTTRWCTKAEFGAAGCPAHIGESTAVRFRPGVEKLPPGTEYKMGMDLISHPVHAFTGNVFANLAGARTLDPKNSLLYVQSQSNMKVRISVHSGGFAGRVFIDMDQDGTPDAGTPGLGGQCVSVDGTNYRGQHLVYSTRTDDTGAYDFTPLAENRVYNSADCSGPLLPHFNGLIRGTYNLSKPTSTTGHGDGRDHAGDAGGTVGTNRISQIILPAGHMGRDYHFTEVPAQPRLTLISTITNDHGGTATVARINLQAGNTTSPQPLLDGTSGTPAVTDVSVPVGPISLSGSALPGYRAGHWQCVVNGQPVAAGTAGTNAVGTPPSPYPLTLGHGDKAICTIHYDDEPSRLTLVSTVTHSNGGTARPEDFVLHADGPTQGISGASGSGSVTGVEVLPGVYALREDELPNYVAGAWQCDAGSLDGNRLTLAQGEHASCTINNTDQPVSLTLVLAVLNAHGGTATERDTSVSANGPDSIHGISGTKPVTVVPVRPGVYQLAEPTLPGYLTGKWVCSAGTLEGNTLTLDNHQNVTCRIELKDIPATLKVTKAVAGQVQPVAGTESDYQVQYRLSVQHQAGGAGLYSLTDTPAFDPDVKILGTQITKNAQPMNLTAANDGSWLLADEARLAIGAEDEYLMSFRIRVPYGSSTANNTCASGTAPSGKGLYNSLTLRNLSADSVDGPPLTGQACIDTPVPISKARLSIEKTSTSRSAEVGDLISYQLRIRNQGTGPAISPVVVDRLPAGFRLEPGSVRVQNARAASITQGGSRELRIQLDRIEGTGTDATAAANPHATNGRNRAGSLHTGTFAPHGQGSGSPSLKAPGQHQPGDVIITYRVRLGVGSLEGDGTNRVHVECLTPNGAGTSTCSNESRWKVQVRAGIFSEEACVAGQVFVDCNGNAKKDVEELGIPGVRLYLQNGTWMVTDAHGKYSHCGLRPRTHVLKIDGRTLPRRSRLVTSSAQSAGDAQSLFIDAKKGMLHRADFIEGSCSNTVIEQVKARQAQGENTSVQTEAAQPALSFDSKTGVTARPRQQGTDSANQRIGHTRH